MEDYTFRRNYLLIIGAPLFFAACAFLIFNMDIQAGDGGRRASFWSSIPFAKEFLLVCCAFVVGICAIALFSGRPKLTAGSEGLAFTGLWGKKFRIRWDDVEGIDVAKEYLTVRHVTHGKQVNTHIGGMFMMKPLKMFDKFRELRG